MLCGIFAMFREKAAGGSFHSSSSHQTLLSNSFIFAFGENGKLRWHWDGFSPQSRERCALCPHLTIEERVHRLTETQTPSLPRRQGSTQRRAAVGEYVSIAVGVIVVLPSFRWPWTFYLQRCKASVRQINIQSVIDKQTLLFVSSLELKRAEHFCDLENYHRHSRISWAHRRSSSTTRSQSEVNRSCESFCAANEHTAYRWANNQKLH